MGRFEKAKDRLRSVPRDYTFSEAKWILEKMGFIEIATGNTSGSRVCFYRASDHLKIMFHKPHPGNEMVIGAVRSLKSKLEESGDL